MRICYIGRTAPGKALYDGQTVLTREFRAALEQVLPDAGFYHVDLYRYKRRAPICLIKTVIGLLRCRHVVLLASYGGRKFYFPLLYLVSKLFGTKVYCRVIGGTLDQNIRRNPSWVKYLNSFCVTWTEGRAHTQRVRELGVTTVQEAINFKDIPILTPDVLPAYLQPPYRFCTFSRVIREKGIPDAIAAVMEINRRRGAIATLDIYGPIEDNFHKELDALLSASGGCAAYKGCVSPSQSVPVLQQYFLHLFPTTWPSEGFPGTLIDCFSAGLPTVATDWNCNPELLENGTGLCYDHTRPEQLLETMLYAIDHPELVRKMRLACLETARHFTREVALEQIRAVFCKES